MNAFDFDPMTVGNPMTLGMIEEELAKKDCSDCTFDDILDFLLKNGINFHDLPDDVRDEFIDTVWG